MIAFFAVFFSSLGLVNLVCAKSLEQIEHIILFMQENRPFDHYFGTLRGVRGFNDRTPIMLRNGYNSFHQPIDDNDLSQYMLPFRTEANETNAMCMPAPAMGYDPDIYIWNKGKHDRWNTARDPGYGMAYFTREDMSYYYALYDHYAVGDHYYQSVFSSTNPNRMHFFAGSNGLSVGQSAVLDNTEPRPGYNWTTTAEILEQTGISWKVYQNVDNFDDNAHAWFHTFQQTRPGDTLYDKGMKRYVNLYHEFEQDIQAGTLPQVSYIIAPTRKSEHATNHPCAGEDFTSQLLQILFKYPETYAKSVFILNYDEGGQFYDHMWAPTPPIDAGYSSITIEGEVNSDVYTSVPAPVGLGFRVPLLIVSPWTRGNIVNSQVFDHTSIVQFIEKRFNIQNNNLSPWRRLVTGDLLSFFDFDHPDYSTPQNLPDTSDYVLEGDVECDTLPDPIIPAVQSMPKQEEGVRVSRALPYQHVVQSYISSKEISVQIKNTGQEGAAYILFDLLYLKDDSVSPRQYTLEPSVQYTDELPILADSGDYAFVLHSANGFLREFRGNVKAVEEKSAVPCGGVEAFVTYDTVNEDVLINIIHTVPYKAATFLITDNGYDLISPIPFVTSSSQSVFKLHTASVGNWYDITVSLGENQGQTCFMRRFMGRMETGKDTISDPAMSAHKPAWVPSELQPPTLPEKVRKIKREETKVARQDKDARFYPKEEL